MGIDVFAWLTAFHWEIFLSENCFTNSIFSPPPHKRRHLRGLVNPQNTTLSVVTKSFTVIKDNDISQHYIYSILLFSTKWFDGINLRLEQSSFLTYSVYDIKSKKPCRQWEKGEREKRQKTGTERKRNGE